MNSQLYKKERIMLQQNCKICKVGGYLNFIIAKKIKYFNKKLKIVNLGNKDLMKKQKKL